MSGKPRRRSLLAELAGRSTLLLAPLVVVILLLTAIPSPPPDDAPGTDPRREARTFQQSLQERIRSWVPGLAILDGAPLDSADVAMLTRDLFARAQGGRPLRETAILVPDPARESPPGSAPAAAPAPPESAALPRLSGVLIDGPWRQAVIDGQVVREGEAVGEYQVLEIGARSVQLTRKGRTVTLSLGAGS